MSLRLTKAGREYQRFARAAGVPDGIEFDTFDTDDTVAGPPILVLVSRNKYVEMAKEEKDRYEVMAEEAEREIAEREKRRAVECRNRKEQPAPAANRRSGIPTRMPVPPPSPTAPMAKKPEGADWLGRVQTAQGLALRCTCGCNAVTLESAAKVPGWSYMQEALDRRAEVWDLWRFVRSPRCARGGFSFVQTVETSLDRERGLKYNNLILRVRGLESAGEPHRPSHFFAPLPSGTGEEVEKLLRKRDMRPSDWDRLHALLGTNYAGALPVAMARRIPKWEAGDRDVIDLRVLMVHFHARQEFLSRQRSSERTRTLRNNKRNGDNDRSPLCW